MRFSSSQRPGYSRAEDISDAAVHIAGLVLIALAVPTLILLTLLSRDDTPARIAVGIYGAALAAMIGFSALYNLSHGGALSWLYQRLDHSAIYVKIAGTFTPFALLSGQGAVLTASLWGTAVLGVGLKLVSPARWRWLALVLYLGMGWGGVLAGGAILAELPGPVITLMAAGGGLYTIGVAFYLWEGLPFHYTIWHLIVLAASLLFYAAVVTMVLA